jgi:hypothetical protein
MPAALQGTTRDSSFASTRWTVVRQAADSQTPSQDALSALSELCQIYWRPVYIFLRRQGIEVMMATTVAKRMTPGRKDFWIRILIAFIFVGFLSVWGFFVCVYTSNVFRWRRRA